LEDGSSNNGTSESILGVLTVGGDLTAFEEDNSTWNSSSEVWSEQKCADGATKITDVVETHERQKRSDRRRNDENQT